MRPADVRLLGAAAALAAALALCPCPAAACGPSFPPHWLATRQKRMDGLPDGSFLLEAGRLLPRSGERFQVVEYGCEFVQADQRDRCREPPGARQGGGAKETALYEAAAADDTKAKDLEGAAKKLRELLALPAPERRRFSTYAAFMLGQIARRTGGRAAALPWFARVRELATAGFDDPAGLAVASLGEEGRLELDGGDDRAAVLAYARQASFGSPSGATSLLWVARELAGAPARLRRVLTDPLGQRLMTLFAWTREAEWQGLGGKRPKPGQPTLLDALAAVPDLDGADRLAAAAYRAGRFDVAERFAGRQHTPLDAWVRGKLALRRGDLEAAERLLADALSGFPPHESWGQIEGDWPFRPHDVLLAERTILALRAGQFGPAMSHALASCSWPDIATVAERVMTVEELVATVDTLSLAATAVSCPAPEGSTAAEPSLQTGFIRERLRVLLGRRLLREGQLRRALPYFDGTPDQSAAEAYVAALERARAARRDVDRAEALFAAARLAREKGLEILGTELAPDWSWAYHGTYAPSDALFFEDRTREPPTDDGLGEAERARMLASLPRHLDRFHYRQTAADLAQEAALMVPPRSQAYAALLCHAARYVRHTDDDRVRRLWWTWVHHGAHPAEAFDFGNTCPRPDFDRVRRNDTFTASLLKGYRRRHLAAAAAGVLVALGLAAALVLLRRRRISCRGGRPSGTRE